MNTKNKSLRAYVIGAAPVFMEKLEKTGIIMDKYADITVICEKAELPCKKMKTGLLICPDDYYAVSKIVCDQLVTGGMDKKNSITFTSMGEYSAMLSVNREIEIGGIKLERGEKPVKYLHNLTIYENLVLGILKELMFFGF